MSRNSFRIREYIDHMLEAIRRINDYTANLSEAEFLNTLLIQDGVIRNIEILGEAAHNIIRHHPDFSRAHNNIPWEDIYFMRNQVAHGYFSVDLVIV
ncbi:MAG: hypothetical protein JWM78_1563 [Verrucomicrobiaceae bacterium]|nr:hypothetical protein [Verrucomicrobiaceae bacterium]